MTVGSTWTAKIKPLRSRLVNVPKIKCDPLSVKSSRSFTAVLAKSKIRCTGVLRIRKAKTSCIRLPPATTRRFIFLQLQGLQNARAMPNTAARPKTPINFSPIRSPLFRCRGDSNPPQAYGDILFFLYSKPNPWTHIPTEPAR